MENILNKKVSFKELFTHTSEFADGGDIGEEKTYPSYNLEENIKEANSEIEKRKISREERDNKKIQQLKEYDEKMKEKENLLKSKLPDLVKALSKQGLKLTDIGYSKTGMDHDKWAEGDKLNISFQGEPFSNKFRFIGFAGYTTSGRGVNQERLNQKAKKLEDAIKKEANVSSLQVNQFSLEADKKKNKDRVLFTLWL